MDSGNSGSMQSSSGGNEEYDSRGESISTFLNNNSNNPNSLAHFGSISSHNNNNNNNNNSPFLSHHQHPNNTFFDTGASLFPQTSNDLIWSSSRGLISDPNFNTPISSSSNVVAAGQLLHHNQNPFSGSSSLPTMQPPSMEACNVVRAINPGQPDVAKNPKKRTRASRRAPTTVLTTDTTNFRQMVQEFTGIPTAPFTGSPYTRRLDLFSTAGSTMRSSHLDSLGPLYPLRPSAQKLGSNQHGMQKQAQNLLNMQNQILSFNAGASIFNTKLQGGGSSNTINVPSLDELGISNHDQQQVCANLINGNISGQSRNDGNNLSRFWRNNHDGGQENQRLTSFDANSNNNNNDDVGGGGGNYNKLNGSGNSSTSEFHPDQIKGLENECSTGEGPVSSWPCPSD